MASRKSQGSAPFLPEYGSMPGTADQRSPKSGTGNQMIREKSTLKFRKSINYFTNAERPGTNVYRSQMDINKPDLLMSRKSFT